MIREHDVGHRLERVLKIIQASQTDALVWVLDERLARYLAQLLDEKPRRGARHFETVDSIGGGQPET